MTPAWLHILSTGALLLAFGCAAVIAADEIRHPQQMWIMNLVWPVVAMFAGPVAIWGYFSYGRLATKEKARAAKRAGQESPSKTETPFWMMVAKGASHCGSGCTLGDIAAEWLAFLFPAIATWFGW